MKRTLSTLLVIACLSLISAHTLGSDRNDIKAMVDNHAKLVATYCSLQRQALKGNVMALSQSLFVFDKVRKAKAQIEPLKKMLTQDQLKQYAKIVAKFDAATH